MAQADDELLEFGRRPLPGWLTRGVLAAVVLTGVIGVALGMTAGHRPPAASQHHAAPAHDDPTYVRLLAAAQLNKPLTSYVRPDATLAGCRLVPVGSRPDETIAARLRATLPGYRIHDSARTLNQLTALCELQFRARDAGGTVLLVSVAAPERRSARDYVHLEITGSPAGQRVVSSASALTPTGWSVTVGAVGPVADEPSIALLVRLAQDPDLRW